MTALVGSFDTAQEREEFVRNVAAGIVVAAVAYVLFRIYRNAAR